MPVITCETRIEAPVDLCFDLARDVMEWRSPFGPAGACVDAMLLRRHLQRFLTVRGMRLEHLAETRVTTPSPAS